MKKQTLVGSHGKRYFWENKYIVGYNTNIRAEREETFMVDKKSSKTFEEVAHGSMYAIWQYDSYSYVRVN